MAVCAPNAFKGSVAAATAAAALARGVEDAGWRAVEVPVADGGDGTLDVLLAAAGTSARVEQIVVTGPLGRPRRARLGWISRTVAVVEMAEAAGLRLLDRRRDPLGATSQGVGDLIRAALDGGARRIVVGVGGSASTDGGAGILTALGARLLDRAGAIVGPGGGALGDIRAIDLSSLDPRLGATDIEVAVDVRNPLYGHDGAAFVFAPQKGADHAEVARLDAGLRTFALRLEAAVGRGQLAWIPGAGAAGGAAYALAAVGARLLSGAALVCATVGLDAAIAGSDLVITGEGRLDSQTAAGKAPAEVAERAGRAGVGCVAVCGSIVDGEELFTRAISLSSLGRDPVRHARSLLRAAGRLAVEGAPAVRRG